jgi:lipopolysaccharide biosynthesis glycosyltransferase
MNLVFSFDKNYIDVFKVLLHSIALNNPEEDITIYLLHYDMEEEALADLKQTIRAYGFHFTPINCRKFLEESKEITINRYYTIEMYLWLFAPYVLPEDVDRALYLDPDIINLNNMQKFYAMDFEDHLFIAMDYEIKNKIVQPFNNLRLRTLSAEHYFNAGVALLNIKKLREERQPEEISKAVIQNKSVLILPDQDILNLLYTSEIKNASWELFNLDPRLYQLFHLLKPEVYNEEWLEDEVIFIHYGGKHKPWQEREKYKLDLGKYYFDYEEKLKQISKESSVNVK